ncbi:MAG: DUF5013 domain-containing protein [Bacteroidales bacterium]|nr:DUF5013 domain-containing protein [Bacteroidales bacterium]
MKHLSYFTLILSVAASLSVGCKEAEIPVPDPVSDVKAYPGINRAKVEFAVPSDAVSYKVFHSKGKYAQGEVTNPSEIQSVIVEDLAAGENILRVEVSNADGKVSTPQGVIIDIYDASYYGANIANRDLIDQNASDTSVDLYFSDANDDESALVIEYVGQDGSNKVLSVAPSTTQVTVSGIDLSKDYYYYSLYKPTADFIDEYKSEARNANLAKMKTPAKENWLACEGEGSEALDNNASTVWKAQGGAAITIDFQGSKIFDGFTLVQKGDFKSTTFATRYMVEYSDDNATWELVKQGKLKSICYKQSYEFAESVNAKYIRISFPEVKDASLPIAIAEVDFYNDIAVSGNCGEDMPKVVNGTNPFETDGSDRFALVGPGRFQAVTGWIQEGTYITADADGGPAFCLWAAPVWGCSEIDNGKIYQVFNLLPGEYGYKVECGHTSCIDDFAGYLVAAKGTTIPRMDALSGSEVLGSSNIKEHLSSVTTMSFTVQEAGNVSLGIVYSLYNAYGVYEGGQPWSDLYMKSFELIGM